jgi:hypothetical protein
MTKDRWIWMPHAGHFICSDHCIFHLNTYVGGYVVSTVGELWNERAVREIHAKIYAPEWLQENAHLKGDEFDSAYMRKFGYEEIGCDRKYETMVFKAQKSNNKCCPYKIIVSEQVESNAYNEPEDAYKGHLELCEKWAERKINEVINE